VRELAGECETRRCFLVGQAKATYGQPHLGQQQVRKCLARLSPDRPADFEILQTRDAASREVTQRREEIAEGANAGGFRHAVPQRSEACDRFPGMRHGRLVGAVAEPGHGEDVEGPGLSGLVVEAAEERERGLGLPTADPDLGSIETHHTDTEPRSSLLMPAVRLGRDLNRLLRQFKAPGVVAMAAPQRTERTEQPGLSPRIAGRRGQAERRLQIRTGRLPRGSASRVEERNAVALIFEGPRKVERAPSREPRRAGHQEAAAVHIGDGGAGADQ
jgi:hypothetical protein